MKGLTRRQGPIIQEIFDPPSVATTPADAAKPTPPDAPPLPRMPDPLVPRPNSRRMGDVDLAAAHLRSQVMDRTKENQPPELTARRARFEQALYSVGWKVVGSKESEDRVYERYNLRASPKVKAIGEDFWPAFANEMDKPRVMAVQINVPRHAMMAVGNGRTGEFRFFDPNAGIFLFSSASEMADFISRYSGPEGKTNPLSVKEMKAALEVALPQSFGPTGSQLGEGICKALSLSVARWFFDHPDFSGPINTTDLGIKEFEPIESGLKSLDERAYKNAATSFLIALDLMSSESKVKSDDFGTLQEAESLARSSDPEGWQEALYRLQRADLESPYVSAILGLAFAKIQGKEDYKGVALEWTGYQQDRVSVQQLIPA